MKVGDFIKEGAEYGLVIACGKVAFDVVWTGGSTTRYRHGVRDIRVVPTTDVDFITGVIPRKHLEEEAAAAKAERRRGARIHRGTVSPSR